MASSKRSFSDMSKSDNQPNDSKASSRPTKRKRFGAKPKSKSKDGSINALKKRVRTIERLFNKNDDIPGHIRVELERELSAHKASIAEITYRKKRSEMIKKYHMVRFFERQKAERLVKQLKKRLSSEATTEKADEIKAKLEIAEVDLAYTRYYPFLEPYISLYPKKVAKDGSTATAKAALDAERPPIWKEVQEALGQGTRALEKLRDRNPDGEPIVLKADKEPQAFAIRKKSPKDKVTEDDMDAGPSDQESDSDGFFEE
ncbi:hypothetical protein jhhlp_006886 [Lomentospora prolificans]|uniref:rRNA-processing protein EFG1 n=1 Tax=Lomentospora prolificans TaxID=41688 RepID=A0A2N3N2Z9_9PEZI|nr:hypothetical protein jhhlp_006886 [Lomentospora prolificans]